CLLSTVAAAAAFLTASQSAYADPYTANAAVKSSYKHVLLISVDGLHSVDLTNWLANNPTSNLAQLAKHAVIYPNAFTTAPSDSYPGMLAQVTGASPKAGGLFYDDSYDRTEYPSKAYWTSQGLPDAGCTGQVGAEITNFEALDKSFDYATGLVADYTG